MKTFKILTTVFFLLVMMSGNVKAQTFWSNNRESFNDTSPVGNTEGTPIVIGNAKQLAELAYRVRNGSNYSGRYIRVTKGIKIDLEAHFWDIPIGTSSARPFQGKFDGNGCTIQNVYMGVKNTVLGSVGNCYGLFGYTETGAEIKNVTVERIVVEEEPNNGPIDTNIQFYSSFICFARNTTVKNCTVKNFALLTGGYGFYCVKDYGGFIADAYNTTIKKCNASGSITASEDAREYVGGFIGKTSGTTTKIDTCSFSGTVFTTGNVRAGGFAGSIEGTVTFEHCDFEGEIKTEGAGWGSTGGFVGHIKSGTPTIQNCTSTGKISGQYSVGGFIGEAGSLISAIYPNVTITGCRFSGSVIGFESYIGGFAGSFSGRGSIGSCLVETPVLGFGSRVGGFFGRFESGGGAISISNCRATGAVEGHGNFTGGFAGSLSGINTASSTITNCFAEGQVTGQNDVGGFAASASYFTFSSCASYGDVKGNDHVGGFIGNFSVNTTITDCYTTGHVTGNDRVGGFAGSGSVNISATVRSVSNCYAINRVKGNDRVGGFIGSTGGITNIDFINCFTASTIFCENPDGKKLVGGFVGENLRGNFKNCYFDTQMAEVAVASGTPNVTGINGLPTSELTKGSLTDFLANKWDFKPGYYPQLAVFTDRKAANAMTRLRSALSVIPLTLKNEEPVGGVQTVFSLHDKTTTGDIIYWFADPIEMVEVKNHAVYWFPSEEWRTLTLRVGKLERTVQFRSEKNVVTTDINVVSDIKPLYNSDLGKFTFTIGCTEKELAMTSVFVQISVGGFAKIDPDITGMTLNANQPPQTVTVKDSTHQTKTYTFEVKKSLHPDIFVQRWNDVLAVNNNIYTNGGHNFTGYKWFKGGTEITDARGKGYIQEKGGLTGIYTATLTSQKGEFNTCAAKIVKMPSMSAVYPNPVQRGQSVRVGIGKMGEMEEAGEMGKMGEIGETGKAVIQIFDTMGNIISKQTLNDPVAEIAMPDMPGQYILQVMENGVSETFKIIVE